MGRKRGVKHAEGIGRSRRVQGKERGGQERRYSKVWLQSVLSTKQADDFITEWRYPPGSLPFCTPEGSPEAQSWGSQFAWGEKTLHPLYTLLCQHAIMQGH